MSDDTQMDVRNGVLSCEGEREGFVRGQSKVGATSMSKSIIRSRIDDALLFAQRSGKSR